MTVTIKLRMATMGDAELLLDWRNDPQTLESSHDNNTVDKDDHLNWVTRALNDPDRQLLIAEENGVPVGTVRADDSEGVYKLSWTVSPNCRGRGLGKTMVAELARQITAPIRAEVKSENEASIRIAEHAGMNLQREANGIKYFQRGELKTK